MIDAHDEEENFNPQDNGDFATGILNGVPLGLLGWLLLFWAAQWFGITWRDVIIGAVQIGLLFTTVWLTFKASDWISARAIETEAAGMIDEKIKRDVESYDRTGIWPPYRPEIPVLVVGGRPDESPRAGWLRRLLRAIRALSEERPRLPHRPF